MTVYDVAVVGAGLSAGPVLERLAKASATLRILVLERGAQTWPDVLWYSENGRKIQHRWWTAAAPGGAANLWYGQVSRFIPQDFQTPRAWPVGWTELQQSYDAICRILRPYCAEHLLHGKAPDLTGLTTPRARIASFERAVFDHLTTHGVVAYSGQTCLGGHGWSVSPVDPITLRRLGISAPEQHQRNWVHRISRLCEEHSNIHLVTPTCVNELDDQGESILLRCVGLDQFTSTYSARHVILAAGVAETVPLLSTLPHIGEGLGAGFTLSSELTAYIQTEIQRQHPDDIIIGSFAHVSFRGDSSAELDPAYGKFSVYDALAFDGRPRLLKKLLSFGIPNPERSIENGIILKVSFKGQSEPAPTKQIGPDAVQRVRVDYTPTTADLSLISDVEGALLRTFQDFPGARVLGITDNIRGNDHTSAHFHGGAAFGESPLNSVLDPDCRVWKHPKVLVADGSFMPGSGSTNSSLTVMANAWRITDALVQHL